MSTYLYDESVTTFLSDIFGKKVYVTPSNTIIRNISDITKDKLQLPLLNVERSGVQVQSVRNSYMNHIGLGFTKDGQICDPHKTEPDYRLQAVPMTINYIIDIWTRDRKTNDNIFRELVMYLVDNPELLVQIPYGADLYHKFNLFLEETVNDNSDIVNHPSTGTVFRTSINAYTDDAYLFRTPGAQSYSMKYEGIHVIDMKYRFEY